MPGPDYGLLFFLFVVGALPGPLNLVLMTTGIAGRVRFGSGILAGGAVAYGGLFAVASAMTREIAGWDPRIIGWLQLAATLVLLRLAWKIATAPVDGSARTRAGAGLWQGAAAGLAMVLTGAKAFSTALAAAALYCDGRLGPAEHAVLFGLSADGHGPAGLRPLAARGDRHRPLRHLAADCCASLNVSGGASIAAIAAAMVV